MSESFIIEFFQQYAYQPMAVYSFVVLFMLASGLGLPFPEEITLISVGLLAYMARHPDVYPPPYEGAVGVDTWTLAIVCFSAVVLSDTVVYLLGKYFGTRITKTKIFNRFMSEERFAKVNYWFQKYSSFACAVFRFTPGIRFPGHLSCGIVGIPVWKFLAIDAAVALVSVPTQVFLVSYYGEIILDKLKEFKLILLAILAIAIVVYFGKKYLAQRKAQRN
jgi:membrane protein DedA with SNARE-associated domain